MTSCVRDSSDLTVDVVGPATPDIYSIKRKGQGMSIKEGGDKRGVEKGYHKDSATVGKASNGIGRWGGEGRKKGKRKEERKKTTHRCLFSPYAPYRDPTTRYPYTVA